MQPFKSRIIKSILRVILRYPMPKSLLVPDVIMDVKGDYFKVLIIYLKGCEMEKRQNLTYHEILE